MMPETATIPAPIRSLFPRFRCGKCQSAYFTRPGYRGHYALIHILGLSLHGDA